jgi:hypothetical protein
MAYCTVVHKADYCDRKLTLVYLGARYTVLPCTICAIYTLLSHREHIGCSDRTETEPRPATAALTM